jgi:hypothetical protein
VAGVLSGKVNPSGKLPVTFPPAYAGVPSASSFPQDCAPGPASLTGNPDSGDRKPVRNIDHTVYKELRTIEYSHPLTVLE